MILGVLQAVTFESKQVQLEKGDILLLYTDGVTEAESTDGEFFGDERLHTLLREAKEKSSDEIVELLLHQIRMFTGLRHFNDDVSLVVMRITE